jgi:hypothetical protein
MDEDTTPVAKEAENEGAEPAVPEDLEEKLEDLRSAREASRQEVQRAREALQKIAREVP